MLGQTSLMALVVFSRPELLTDGVKEPVMDTQGTWAWARPRWVLGEVGHQVSAMPRPDAPVLSPTLGISPLPLLGLPPRCHLRPQVLPPHLPSLPTPPPERDSWDRLVDETPKRQGLQGKFRPT